MTRYTRKGSGTRLVLSASRKKNRGGERLAAWRNTQRQLFVSGHTTPTTARISDENDQLSPEIHQQAPDEYTTTQQCNIENALSFDLTGRRIIDIRFFLNELKEYAKHGKFGCGILYMEVISEIRRGLISDLKIKCKMCNHIQVISTDGQKNDEMNCNAAAVAGITKIGCGYSNMEEFLSTLNVPPMSANTFNKEQNYISEAWERTALKEMEIAANEEKKMAIQRGDIDAEGIPYITVVVDGTWAKRSYRTNYASLSGVYSKRQKTVDEIRLSNGAIKLGWIQGVFVRCLLNIWGVMLFLRLSWVVGQAGIGLGCLVILLATAVTVLTTLSMSAICTNGEVKGGGTYYMISRSLGPEFGGAIGLIFALANAVAVAMYVVGFAETLIQILKVNGLSMVDGEMNDIRIVGCITVLFLLGIAIIGTEWESKAQIVLLVILLISMADFVIGSFIPPNVTKVSRGFIGWNTETIMENFGPDFREETFFSVFAVFFPAATGILAGANISGDLADPQVAIPKGTFLAILITTLSYIWFAFTAGAVVVRDANGNESLVQNFTELITNCSLSENGKCEYGLMNSMEVMGLVSAFEPIIYAGIFAATLSSALASLVSAPKVFQALCKDKLFPSLHFFARGYGKNNEPRRGYALAFVIALGCVAIGDLNSIAPIISNFFLAAYCLINFSCFHATFARSPGFRPSFKYYNLWLSLLGAILCLMVMFTMNWWTALLTFAIILALYIYIYHRKPDVNWGSSTQAQTYKTALSSAYRLNNVPEHVKNYRPQILVLTGCPSSRPPLIDFAYHITKKISLLVCGHVLKDTHSQKVRDAYSRQAYQFLNKRKIKSFYVLIENDSFSAGVRALIQSTGLGKMRPNVLFMGYKSNWQECDVEEVIEYFNVIHEAFDKHMALGILRLQEGLDYSEFNDIEEVCEPPTANGKKSSRRPSLLRPDLDDLPRNASSAQLSTAGSSRESSPVSTPLIERKNPAGTETPSSMQVVRGLSKAIPKDVLTSVNQFQRKQKKGTIDVWWLYDDGGLTMLIPYLLTTHSQWSGCKLRVFSLANKKDELDREQRNMAALLSKFRIEYSDVMVIPDITKPPQESSRQDFEKLISKWRESEDAETENPHLISLTEILALKDKTNRHMRLRELLVQYSQEAALIVMTLPMPRKNTCSAPMYMAWLETLTRDMPPFLLVRGNQTSVLTFYS